MSECFPTNFTLGMIVCSMWWDLVGGRWQDWQGRGRPGGQRQGQGIVWGGGFGGGDGHLGRHPAGYPYMYYRWLAALGIGNCASDGVLFLT